MHNQSHLFRKCAVVLTCKSPRHHSLTVVAQKLLLRQNHLQADLAGETACPTIAGKGPMLVAHAVSPACRDLFSASKQALLRGFAAATMLVSAWPVAAQVDLGLSPMRVEFPAVPGRPFSGSLVLSNAGSATSRVRVEMLDVYVDETTTPQFVANAPAEAAWSCRNWLSANPMELELGPRRQALVRYTVRVPATASERSFHCALGFRTLPTVSEETGTSMHTAVRMIAVFYATVGKPAISGVIKELRLEPVAIPDGTVWRAVVIMENSGSVLYRPMGELEIVDSSGKVVESQKVTSFPVLPKRQQRYVLPLKSSLSPGPYTLKARIEVGGEIQEASVAVVAEVPAPTEAPPQQ